MFQNPDKSRYIAPSHVRVLMGILYLSQQGETVTLRKLAKLLGCRSWNALCEPLKSLERHELIGRGRFYESATIHPRCYFKILPETKERQGVDQPLPPTTTEV